MTSNTELIPDLEAERKLQLDLETERKCEVQLKIADAVTQVAQHKCDILTAAAHLLSVREYEYCLEMFRSKFQELVQGKPPAQQDDILQRLQDVRTYMHDVPNWHIDWHTGSMLEDDLDVVLHKIIPAVDTATARNLIQSHNIWTSKRVKYRRAYIHAECAHECILIETVRTIVDHDDDSDIADQKWVSKIFVRWDCWDKYKSMCYTAFKHLDSDNEFFSNYHTIGGNVWIMYDVGIDINTLRAAVPRVSQYNKHSSNKYIVDCTLEQYTKFCTDMYNFYTSWVHNPNISMTVGMDYDEPRKCIRYNGVVYSVSTVNIEQLNPHGGTV